MKECNDCGEELQDGWNFCPECGLYTKGSGEVDVLAHYLLESAFTDVLRSLKKWLDTGYPDDMFQGGDVGSGIVHDLREVVELAIIAIDAAEAAGGKVQ